MREKTKSRESKMSVSIRVSLLVLVAVCLNLNSRVSGRSLALTHKTESKISTDINAFTITISNDLPPSPTKLSFFADFQRNEVEIRRGNPYTKLLTFDNHTGGLRWKQCAEFSVIPALERGHSQIFWSVRQDALYHSWDGKNWENKEPWNVC